MNEVRTDLVAHLREQIERDPEAFASSRKLEMVLDRIVRDAQRNVD